MKNYIVILFFLFFVPFIQAFPAPLPYPKIIATQAGSIALEHIRNNFEEKSTTQELEHFFVFRIEYKLYKDCSRMPSNEEMNPIWGWYVEVLRGNDMSMSSVVFIVSSEKIIDARDYY